MRYSSSCIISFLSFSGILTSIGAMFISMYCAKSLISPDIDLYYEFALVTVLTQIAYTIPSIIYLNPYAHQNSRAKWIKSNRLLYYSLFMLCFVFSIYCFFNINNQQKLLVAIAGIITLGYFGVFPRQIFSLRSLPYFKNVITSLVWTMLVFLPLFNTEANMISWNLKYLIFLQIFILMMLLCLIFDERDEEIDIANKLKTFPVLLEKKILWILKAFLIGIFLLLSFSVVFSSWWLVIGYIMFAIWLVYIAWFLEKANNELFMLKVDSSIFIFALIGLLS